MNEMMNQTHSMNELTRQHSENDLTRQHSMNKVEMKGDCAFSCFGPSVWNSVKLHIRSAATMNSFKFTLKTSLFNFQESCLI